MLLSAALAFLLAADLPSFPGAQGFGATTPGGRGGRILFVDNLADHGPQSLRAALETKGPRLIVFRTSGWIDLETPLKITEPHVTILGQTSPGGIGIRRHGLVISTHDVILRHFRSRLGPSAQEDAISVSSPSRRVILDHVSASWSVDETLSVSGDVADITVQYSLIAESLRQSLHAKGTHGYGSLVRATGGVSLHHNIWAHHDGRNPRLGDNYGKGDTPTFDLRHNILYNWGSYATGLVEGRMQVNYVGNLLLAGPSSNPRREAIYLKEGAAATPHFYLENNRRPGFSGAWFTPGPVQIAAAPFATPPVNDAQDALAQAGATLPQRDAVDTRILSSITQRSGSLINSPDEVGGWPTLAPKPFPPDQDSDGLPDAADTPNLDSAALAPSGYTHLEEYWNQQVPTPHGPAVGPVFESILNRSAPASTPVSALATGPEQGHLLVIGGGAIGQDIWEELARLASGYDAPLVYIPTAGDKEPGPDAAKFLRDAGFTDVTTLHTRDPQVANQDSFVAPLRRARAVFFGGGRQWRLVDSYANTLAEKELAAVLSRGGVIAGTSAGATIQGDYLVRGSTQDNTTMMDPAHDKGFAYLRNVAIDQHLLKRKRENDLWQVIDKYPHLLGIGLDEGTAISVTGQRFTVLGSSLVAIYDASRVQSQPRHYFLAPGVSFDLKLRKIID